MTKAEIVQALYDRLGGFSKKEATAAVDAVFDLVKETLGRGESVKISGFGKFTLRDKRQRTGRNPQTGEPMPIRERRVLTFRVSEILKRTLNPEVEDTPPAVHRPSNFEGLRHEPAALGAGALATGPQRSA